jgi:hypothetical protein
MRKTSEKSENLKHANLDNELIILPLDEADDLSSFNCDSEELNDFLKTNALVDQKNLVNRIQLCFYNESLAGFYSLAADTIETKNVLVSYKQKLFYYMLTKYTNTCAITIINGNFAISVVAKR